MKDGIHPNYRDVCFQDMSNGFKFVTRSCANAKEMIIRIGLNGAQGQLDLDDMKLTAIRR